jgi:hypothetical protein
VWSELSVEFTDTEFKADHQYSAVKELLKKVASALQSHDTRIKALEERQLDGAPKQHGESASAQAAAAAAAAAAAPGTIRDSVCFVKVGRAHATQRTNKSRNRKGHAADRLVTGIYGSLPRFESWFHSGSFGPSDNAHAQITVTGWPRKLSQ